MLLRGMISGSSPANSLFSATICLLVFAAIGYVMGQIADRVVLESVNQQFAAELKARNTAANSAPPNPLTKQR
jgi:hypothetical protein